MSGEWRFVSGRAGGTVTALVRTTSSGGPDVVFAATAVGLHRSSDGGRSWAAISAGMVAPPIEAAAASPAFARDGTLVVGGRGGLARSIDGGRTWLAALSQGRVLAAAISPAFERDRLLLVGTESDGVLRSEDGGRTWASANPGLLDLTVLSIALSPAFETDGIGFAGTASGVYRTRSGGKAWRPVELPAAAPAVQCLALSPGFAEDRLVVAGSEADGLFVSRDGGATWEAPPGLAGRGVAAVACSRARLAAATADGVLLSPDGGTSWRGLGAAGGPALSLLFLPDGRADEVLLAGVAGEGVWRLEDQSWQPASSGLYGRLLVRLAVSPGFARDRTLFLAGVDDGLAVSRDGGATWSVAGGGLGAGPVFDVALSPTYVDDRTLFAATAGGVFRSQDAAASWEPARPGGAAALVATGPDGRVLAARQDGVLFASGDGGSSWQWLAGPGPGAIVAVACALAQDALVAGATGDETVLWRSTDAGQSWHPWLVAPAAPVVPLAVSPGNTRDGVLLAGIGKQVLRPAGGSQEPPVWRGTTLGDEAGIVTAVAAAGRLALAGTSTGGVYRSRDAGRSFAAWADGFSEGGGPVTAVALAPGDGAARPSFALGLGSGVWRRDAAPD